GLILAYGYLGIATSFASVQLPQDVAAGSGITQWLVRITLASALLHFYYDGFIWRMREKEIRRDLGVQDGKIESGTPKPRLIGNLRPALLWSVFAVATAYMGYAQYRGWSPDFGAQVGNLAEAIPGNWRADFLAGTQAKGQGDLEVAEQHYRKAVLAKPDFAMGHLFLGDILYKQGRHAEAAEAYRRSLDLDPDNQDGRKNLANLYLRTGQPAQAAERFGEALGAEPGDAELNHGMALALLRQGKVTEAEPYAAQALRLAPDHSGALNDLGMIRDVQGDVRSAVEYYRRALAADSNNASARENLAAAAPKAAAASGSGK
ncbi:MAG: tetratricopeptide repeat protein, partial [Fibrobacteria bacterium]